VKPAAKLAPQPWMTAPETRAVLAALTARGTAVRFVGGCVRDAVLERAVKDVDLATPDPPETVMRLLKAAGIRAVPTGLKHGTVTAVIGRAHFEVTTLRRDVETHGRHATVAFTDDWADDAARRDFTINALFCDPDGTLYDPFGGLEDLRAGRVRFVGDALERIEEDVLRLLRFFRFHAHHGRPPPDADALAACREMAPALHRLSGERVRAELLRLLIAPHPAGVLELMQETGVLERVLPEVAGADALLELCAVEAPEADGLRRLALLLRRSRGGAEAVAKRLRMSNAEKRRLAAMVEPAVAVAAGLDVRARRRALYRVGSAPFADLVYLAWAEALARAPEDREALARAHGAMIETAREWESPRLPVRGADVVALGVKSGPAVSRLLAAVEEWWEAGDYRASRTETLKKLGELVATASAS
jgi:poly(A) polymerase